jgi:2,3,4,5-tetrahydropyridine-2-carboxylate N-succinyltransferase
LNIRGIFPILPNVAWQDDRPMDAAEIDEALIGAAFNGVPYAPTMVDKFPLYLHRVNAVKLGVRITDEHKVRLGAYLGEGTVLMPGASYINFNAGTEGPTMVEGRISSSAFVGKGSDVGDGASIIGILAGGNNVPISVGRNCLLEINCTLGISIGDAVIIRAGTAVMSSSLVHVRIDEHKFANCTVKAVELSGINAVTFRRNDHSGELEVIRTLRNEEFARKLKDGESILSADLHGGQ